MSNIKLFCFPYAGGSASMFSKWKPFLNMNTGIELIPVELAGRGKRIQEPLYSELSLAIEDLYQIISPEITDYQYALFGHSLGGLLVYELAQKIRRLNVRQPLHLFFSGKSAPNIERERDKKYHLMAEDEFRLEVMKLGGTPPEFFDHPELMDFFLPLLRNDFRLAETNLAGRPVIPFDCNISVFLGKSEEISAEQADSWKVHTNGACTVHYFEGDHFFLHDHVRGMLELIAAALTKHSTDRRIGVAY